MEPVLSRTLPTNVPFRAAALSAVATLATLTLLAPLPDRIYTAVTAWSVLLAAVIYLIWGALRRNLTSGWLWLQTAGVLAYGALAVTAITVDGTLARYLLAAGWLAHAVWDAFHHHADRVVPRWYAEACMTSDVIIAAALIATA